MRTPITIFGAGSIGAYLGTRLASAGAPVHLVGRAALAQDIHVYGLTATDHHGHRSQASPAMATEANSDMPAHGLVLVCVKSADTPAAAEALKPWLTNDHTVVSFQNGVGNAQALQDLLPGVRVLPGMVPFNVVGLGQGRFHQGSDGSPEVQDNPWWQSAAGLDALAAFEQAGLPLARRPQMGAVLWSKLILNLNNPINALSGLPLKTELSQRGFRQCLAMAQREALSLVAKAGLPLAKVIAIPTTWVPWAMSVPDVVFQRLGSKMLDIDPNARSSMWEDLERGRTTEIDWINGEVVRLAESLGIGAPVNAELIALIREAERGGRRNWSGPELLARLKSAAHR